jgi:hypothetical protein
MKDPDHEPEEADPTPSNHTGPVDPGNGKRQGTLQFVKASEGFSDPSDVNDDCSSPVQRLRHCQLGRSWAFFHNRTSETWQRLNRDHIKTKGAETMCTFVLDHPNHDACNDDDCGQQHEICSTCNRRRHVDDPAA